MVAEIIAGPITEIINNRILGNPIFHRFGKKARISPSLLKVMLMMQLFMPAAILVTSPQNWRSPLCAQFPQLLVYWLSPSTHPTKTKTVVLSISQIFRVHSLGQLIPSLRISSRSLERVNLPKLLGIHFSVNIYLGKTACPQIVKSPATARLAFYGKLKALQEIVT